jgi:quercetin dioxygenase-like cupin family protein
MMTTHRTSLNAFALAARQGRTPEPLDILGEEVLVKLTNADTNGAAAVFHLTVPPMSGPPRHRHSREDEWFYVLDGQITAEVDGQRTVLHAGDSGFASRGTAHAFQNFGHVEKLLKLAEEFGIKIIEAGRFTYEEGKAGIGGDLL